MDINKIMMFGMAIFVLGLCVYFIGWNYLEISYLYNNGKDFSNWFTLFLGLPFTILVSIRISKYYFEKSRKKEIKLYENSQTREQVRKIDSQTFMFHCFNTISNIINDKLFLDNFLDNNFGMFEPVIIIIIKARIDMWIVIFEQQIKRLRSIPKEQAHDACDQLEIIVQKLKKGKFINKTQMQLDYYDFFRIPPSVTLLLKFMNIKQPNNFEQHFTEIQSRQDADYVKD